jgi:hypothetical protein
MKEKFPLAVFIRETQIFNTRSEVYNTPQLAAEFGSRACPGVYTRDSNT